MPVSVPAVRDWTPQALDALFGVVQDVTANPKARRKAALKIAEFLLPKAGKKAKAIPDEYGFSIRPNLACAYWDTRLELRMLVNGPMRKIPAIAEKIKKLEARSDAIRRQVELPCPTIYGVKEGANDVVRLIEFNSLRGNETVLTETQKAAEAHLRLRLDVFNASPEAIARRRCAALEDAELRFKRSRSFGEFHAAPLSRRERNELNLLRRLYPAEPKRNLSELDGDGLEIGYHPFRDELPTPDGNFYPRHSKLRSEIDHRKWLEQLGTVDRKAKEDAEDQQNPEPSGNPRICELEERRAVGFELTASEEGELRDLRERHPEYAAVVDLLDLRYLYHWRREVERARKVGLNTSAMFEQADVICLRLRDPTKFTTESEAEDYRRARGGQAAVAALYSDRFMPAFK